MCMKYLVLFVVIGVGAGAAQTDFQNVIKNMEPSVSPTVQTKEALGVIKRIIPEHAKKFNILIDPSVKVNGKDTFILKNIPNDIVLITANSGVAAIWGFNYYLKYYCNSHVSWDVGNVNIPIPLPEVDVTISANDWIRYYQNVCTTSYSFVWWGWAEWEKHIDWIALNGINLVLTFNGQEAIWKRVYKRLPLTQQEINEHFAGPAFLSWSRMGNIRGFGGPLPSSWHVRSMGLQKLILHRMRNLGIKTVLPAFAGHVPRAFKRLWPKENYIKLPTWNSFNDTYCCTYLLDPTSRLFQRIGNIFMQEQITQFGTDSLYNCDTFNEMEPSSNNLTYLSNIGKAIYSSMVTVDPKAIWLLQGWAFYSEQNFWQENETKAFLTSVEAGKMIVLDLQSEQFPQYTRLDSYYGQPFVWCMLHNFGGTLGLFGSLDIINEDIFPARTFPNSTLVGTGLTPEGIHQNYVVYDLMTEMSWRKESVKMSDWISHYILRRYGAYDENAEEAWAILQNTVYNYKGLKRMRGKYVLNRRPSLKISTWIWYDFRDIITAWNLLLNASDKLGKRPAYLHDLVDVTRQMLQLVMDQYYTNILKSYRSKNVPNFQDLTTKFLECFDKLDLILASNEAFLLGKWLNSAKAAATNKQEEQLYEFNARNQITLWGPNGEISDYANKQWAGVVSHYFKPRWVIFLSALNASLVNDTPFDAKDVQMKIFKEVEEPFSYDRTNFTDVPLGDSIEIAKDIRDQYRHVKGQSLRKKNRRKSTSTSKVQTGRRSIA